MGFRLTMYRKLLGVSSFSTFAALRKEVPRNLKNKSKTAQEWISRQLSDPYVKEARIHNFRCRSAFKLLQIDEKYQILKPGDIVIDCGAAPGSWSQIAVTKTNSNGKEPELPTGKVIGIDKITVSPIEGAIFLCPYDFTAENTQARILQELNGSKVDSVLSDMAPNATGHKRMDHEYLMEMVYSVLRFAVLNTKINGTLLVKVWNGNGINDYENNLKKFYNNVKVVKPDSSRDDSAEMYFLARQFKGARQKTTS
ncbi:rRNA methyltransferase 2, mitochondrial [Planococcus citri]|uniref:rRNA methyltransferase 2, mitochondrial n=1 Tax=Planococcus citri TaxID=170843 RepID=UPI0031F8A993